MKLIPLALAVLVAATAAMPAAAQHRRHHGAGRSCHMEYRHHHRVQVCRR